MNPQTSETNEARSLFNCYLIYVSGRVIGTVGRKGTGHYNRDAEHYLTSGCKPVLKPEIP